MIDDELGVDAAAFCLSVLSLARPCGPTDGPTDRPTDRRTDRPGYRDARTHLKMKFEEGKDFKWMVWR